MGKLEIVYGDITKQKADTIVNAANKSLLAGGGVDGAIHRAAGRELEIECKELGGCPTGEAKITKSYNLEKAGIGWVIHAVGPRWLGGNLEEEKSLESAYKNALRLAAEYSEVYPKQCLEVLERHIQGLDEDTKNDLKREIVDEAKLYVKEHPIKIVAFPSISTGIYHFPIERAADIAVKTIKEFLEKNSKIEKVIVACFDERTYKTFLNHIKKATRIQ